MRRPVWIVLATVLAMQGGFWLLWLAAQAGQGAVDPRDWVAFQRAAERTVTGTGWLYPDDFFADDYRFMYPPYGVWYFLPLAFTPGAWAYALMTVVQLTCLGGALTLLRRALPPVLVAGVVGSAWLSFDLMIGQLAPSFLALLVVATWLWVRGMRLRAGLVAGLVALKPHFVWPVVLLAAVTDRRVFAGLALCGIGLFASTLPLGLEVWPAWLEVIRIQGKYATTELTVTHNVTLASFVRGLTGSPQLSRIVGLVVLPPALAAGVYGAWKNRSRPDVVMSLAVLLALSVNPYVNTYDLLLLTLPVATWWSRRTELDRRVVWGLLVALGACWAWDLWIVWYRHLLGLGRSPVGSATGTLALVWLFLWASSQGSGTRASPTSTTPATSNTMPTTPRADQDSSNSATPAM